MSASFPHLVFVLINRLLRKLGLYMIFAGIGPDIKNSSVIKDQKLKWTANDFR